MTAIIERLDHLGLKYEHSFSMDRYTTMRVGGLADLVVYPRSSAEIVETLNVLHEFDKKWVVLGGGSNVLVGGKINEVVVSTKKMKNVVIEADGTVEVESGAILGQVLNLVIKAELGGLGFAAGIPGTVGGGIIMNAGANGGEMKDVVECVWIWHEGKEKVFTNKEIGFEYRNSNLPEHSVVTKVRFRLTPGEKGLGEKVKGYIQHRNKTQPVESANSGCIFKNPSEIPAGKLLDELGFKGLRIGQAMFSELHANYIINLGGATHRDVLSLIQEAERAAYERRGISLQREIKIVGEVN